MISSWADCVAKWIRHGMGGEHALIAADAWEKRHAEIDRIEEQSMAEYLACAVFKSSQTAEKTGAKQ